jgi:hypothetical protein
MVVFSYSTSDWPNFVCLPIFFWLSALAIAIYDGGVAYGLITLSTFLNSHLTVHPALPLWYYLALLLWWVYACLFFCAVVWQDGLVILCVISDFGFFTFLHFDDF